MKFTKRIWDVYSNEDGVLYILDKVSGTEGVMRKLAFPGDLGGNAADFVDEAITFIIDADQNTFQPVLDLAAAVKELDIDGIKAALEEIEDDRYHIFDEGLFHLPSEPLQDLVRDLIIDAENMVADQEPEEEEELPPTPTPGPGII